MREELTTEKIIENCKKFRGEEYDYSKVKKWKNGEETKIEVICQHGSYWTNYFDFIRGKANCPKCSKEKRRKHEEEKFKSKMISRYGDDIVFPKDFYYVNSFTKVRIIYKNKEIVRDPHTFLKTTLFSKKIEKEIEVIKSEEFNRRGIILIDFLEETARENNLEFFINDRNDLEIKDHNLVFHLADLLSGEKDSSKRWETYHNENKRCVFVYPPYLENENKRNVYKNILLYHCGIRKRIFARNTVCKIYRALEKKQFFEENNIEGYRNADKAYVLEDKKTGEPYMMYSLGHAYFGKGAYDAEIARGACKLGYQIIGGASKLWKYILKDNPDIKSIVYFVDRREYLGSSIGHLMDSDMSSEGKVYQLKGNKSFMNYWVRDVIGDNGKLWHKAGDYKNREASRNQEVQRAYKRGDAICVHNPGSYTNVFVRKGYELKDGKIVECQEQ